MLQMYHTYKFILSNILNTEQIINNNIYYNLLLSYFEDYEYLEHWFTISE